jgi:hypothetical protein
MAAERALAGAMRRTQRSRVSDATFYCIRCHERMFAADGVSNLGPGFSVSIFPVHRSACPEFEVPLLPPVVPTPPAAASSSVTVSRPSRPDNRRFFSGKKKGVRS